MIHLFIIPIETKPWGPFPLMRVPKYVVQGTRFSMMDYGWEPVGLVCVDTDAAGAAALAAHADVIELPDDLDTQIGAQLNGARIKLRAVHIPAGWLTATTTYREAVRVVVAGCQIMQRLKKYAKPASRLFSAVSLDTTWSAVPAVWRDRVAEAFTDAGFDVSGVTGAMTIEETLQGLLEVAKDTPVAIGLTTV